MEETDLHSAVLQDVDLPRLEGNNSMLYQVLDAMLECGLIGQPEGTMCSSKYFQWQGLHKLKHCLLERA